jgi:hypothetical protein
MTSEVLVLDAASCAHAEACEDIARALHLGAKIALADIVFDRQLRGRGGEQLVRRGLRVEPLADIRPALALTREHPRLSLGDAFSFALVTANGWTLLTSSPVLAKLAEERRIAVRDFRCLTPARVGYPRSAYGLAA